MTRRDTLNGALSRIKKARGAPHEKAFRARGVCGRKRIGDIDPLRLFVVLLQFMRLFHVVRGFFEFHLVAAVTLGPV